MAHRLVPREGVALFELHVWFVHLLSAEHGERCLLHHAFPQPREDTSFSHPSASGICKLSQDPVGPPSTALCLWVTEDRRAAGVGEVKGKQLLSGCEEGLVMRLL